MNQKMWTVFRKVFRNKPAKADIQVLYRLPPYKQILCPLARYEMRFAAYLQQTAKCYKSALLFGPFKPVFDK